MKLSFPAWKDYRPVEGDDLSETNEALLEKKTEFLTFREKPKPLLKFAFVASIAFNLFLLVISATQFSKLHTRNDIFQQMYSECNSVKPLNATNRRKLPLRM